MAAEEAKHVVLIAYPAQGHLSPLIHLARQLASNSFQVTLVNVAPVHNTIVKRWSELSCSQQQQQQQQGLGSIRLEQLPFGIDVPDGMEAKNHQQLREWTEETLRVEEHADELLCALQPTPRCVIADYCWLWSLPRVKQQGIASLIYFPGSAAWATLQHHAPLLVEHGDACQEVRDGDHHRRVIRYVPGIEEVLRADLPDYMQTAVFRDVLTDVRSRMNRWEWILVNSMEELEPAVFQELNTALGPSTKVIGVAPLVPLLKKDEQCFSSLREEDSTCLDWLSSRAPSSVLFVSFGSISYFSSSVFSELAAGLEASGQAFLWVVRPGMVELEAEVSNSLGDEQQQQQRQRQQQEALVKGFVQRTSEQGLVVSWAPQLRVLEHPSVGGFLSHCGWNSVMESLCSGVPILGWPFHSEQALNCGLVERCGFGRRFAPQQQQQQREQLKRGDVQAAVTVFMAAQDAEMKEMRERVKRFQGRVAGGDGGRCLSASCGQLQRFMEAMMM